MELDSEAERWCGVKMRGHNRKCTGKRTAFGLELEASLIEVLAHLRGNSRLFLRVIEREPEAVRRALEG
jgi:hypothetical protein